MKSKVITISAIATCTVLLSGCDFRAEDEPFSESIERLKNENTSLKVSSEKEQIALIRNGIYMNFKERRVVGGSCFLTNSEFVFPHNYCVYSSNSVKTNLTYSHIDRDYVLDEIALGQANAGNTQLFNTNYTEDNYQVELKSFDEQGQLANTIDIAPIDGDAGKFDYSYTVNGNKVISVASNSRSFIGNLGNKFFLKPAFENQPQFTVNYFDVEQLTNEQIVVDGLPKLVFEQGDALYVISTHQLVLETTDDELTPAVKRQAWSQVGRIPKTALLPQVNQQGSEISLNKQNCLVQDTDLENKGYNGILSISSFSKSSAELLNSTCVLVPSVNVYLDKNKLMLVSTEAQEVDEQVSLDIFNLADGSVDYQSTVLMQQHHMQVPRVINDNKLHIKSTEFIEGLRHETFSLLNFDESNGWQIKQTQSLDISNYTVANSITVDDQELLFLLKQNQSSQVYVLNVDYQSLNTNPLTVTAAPSQLNSVYQLPNQSTLVSYHKDLSDINKMTLGILDIKNDVEVIDGVASFNINELLDVNLYRIKTTVQLETAATGDEDAGSGSEQNVALAFSGHDTNYNGLVSAIELGLEDDQYTVLKHSQYEFTSEQGTPYLSFADANFLYVDTDLDNLIHVLKLWESNYKIGSF